MALLIFDLDGTLVDTSSIFIPAVYSALSHFPHVPTPSDEVIKKTFGLTDDKLWETLMPNSTEQDHQIAYALRDEFVKEEMVQAHVLLPHAFYVLDQLHKRGHILTTASNCGIAYLNAVLDSQHIRQFFTNPLCLAIVGGKTKADILIQHLEETSKDEAYMIGDRDSDIEAAHLCGIPAVGCKFGFGDSIEIENADYSISSLLELLNLFDSDSKQPHA